MGLTEAEQHRLINDNMPLVGKVAADFRGGVIEFEDLLAIGRLGLVKAARDFDPSLEKKFSGYASGRIRTEIRNAIRSGDYAPLPQEDSEPFPIPDADSIERVFEWQAWGRRGNAEAICEPWSDLEASPEELLERYEALEGERARMGAAFISLTQRQRRLVRLVYLNEPQISIEQAARELRISYFQANRMLARALDTMRCIFEAMDANEALELEAV